MIFKGYTPFMGFPGGSIGEESACNAGDPGWIPGWGTSPGEGNGSPLQCSCWEIQWEEESDGPQSTVFQCYTCTHYALL